jgi:PleD family two-component response regulator
VGDGDRPGSLSARLSASTRVLGIEDDADIAEFLRAYFRASGYDFVHADPDSADDAVAAIDEHRPDCVLLDMGLRGYSGLEVYRRLRSGDVHRFLPVVVVTADSTAQGQVEAAGTATGIDAFVTKPFNVNTLADVVSRRIDAARALRQRGEPVDPALGVLTTAVLEARLADEIGLARASGQPLAFALVTLRSGAGLRERLGADGLGGLVRRLLEIAGPLVPDDVTLGRTEDDELAVVAPATSPEFAVELLERVLSRIRGPHTVPGGGVVQVDPAAGVAGFPQHATDSAGLFMAADAALADALDRSGLVSLAL